MNKNLKMISLVFILVLVAVLSYFLLVKKANSPASTLEVQTPTPTPISTSSPATASVTTPTTTPSVISSAPTPATSSSPTPKLVATPISFDGVVGGCGNIFVHKINQTNTAGISVSARKTELNLSAQEKTFAIGQTEGLHVEIRLGGDVANSYCNDVMSPDEPKAKKLIGKTGQASITIDQSTPAKDSDYRTTVTLRDVSFVDEEGKDSEVVVDELIFENVKVGWLPG